MLDELGQILTRARDFARPVPPESLPDLRDHFAIAARMFTAVTAMTLALLLGLDETAAKGMSASAQFWWTLLTLASAILHAASWTSVGGRHAKAVFVVNIVALVLGVSFSPVGAASKPVVVFLPVAVLGASAFLPWRPAYSLALTPLTVAEPLLAYRHLGQPFPIAESVFGLVGSAICVTGAVANQIQRHLWARIETGRRRMSAAERMSSLGRMVAGIAHELKTPVAAAQNFGMRIRDLSAELDQSIGHPEVTEADLHEIADELQRSAASMHSALDRTRAFLVAIREQTRQDGGKRERFLIRTRIDQIACLLAHRLKQSRVHLDCDGVPPDLSLMGDPRRFDQILTNLVSNAVDACGEGQMGGMVRVSARLDEEARCIVLRVEDDGPGVPNALRDRIFEPLFTTRDEAHGTGLGLCIARDIAAMDFSGSVTLVDAERGALFQVVLDVNATPHPSDRSPWIPSVHRQPADVDE